MTNTQFHMPVAKEDIKDVEVNVTVGKKEHGSQPVDKSFKDVIQEKIEGGKNSIQQMAHNWRDDLMEPFEDRSDQNEVEQAGKNMVDKTKEQTSNAAREMNGIFTDSTQKGKEMVTPNDQKSYQEMLQEKIDQGKSSITETVQALDDRVKETFGNGPDQNDLKQAGEELRDKTKDMSSRATDKLNETFNDSKKATGKDHESYQEMLQDKIDEGKSSIMDISHKLREEIMGTFGDGSDQNDLKQTGDVIRDKTKEMSSKVQDSWNETFKDSGEKKRFKNGDPAEEGFKSFGQEANEQYEMDRKQAEDAKTEWGNVLESVKDSVKDAMGNFHENTGATEDTTDEISSDYGYSEILGESAGGATVHSFDATNDPNVDVNAVSFTRFQK